MSLADQQWCPTSVQVTVLQARGLRIKGKSGTNDAYAVMQVGKEKYQTSVVEKSVAPVWKEEATFDLPPLLQGGGGKERSTLHVHVLHRALVGPDKLLGQAVINLPQLNEDRTRNKTEWFKLLDKSGKPDKDRGEVLVDIQFMRNNMTASMFDLSAAGKSRSRLGKFKDKVRGKKKESDSASSIVPSFSQILTDSEDEANGDGEAASKDGKSKKLKMKSLFSHKSNLQRNMSQSMSVLPAKNSSLSGSQSSGLNVDSSEGKKKFKFMIHKRSSSSDSKDSSSGHQKQAPVEQSNLCINGSHIYCDEPQPRSSRVSSNFMASSGHGSMEDVPENSPPCVNSLRAVRQYSPWMEEEEEEEEKDNVDGSKKEKEERTGMEEHGGIEEEETLGNQEELEKLAKQKLRQEEEERRKLEEKAKREEEERIRKYEERTREERLKREEEEQQRLSEERRRLEEQERQKLEEEEQRHREEEEERVRREEEKRRQEEERAAERRKEEECKLAEEKRRLKEEEERRIEEEKVRKEEEQRRKEEERAKEAEEAVVRKQEADKMRKREEEERLRREEMKTLEEERLRKEKEEYDRKTKEIKLMEERERIEADKKLEEKMRMEEEMKRKEEEERNTKRQELEEKRRLEDQERRKVEQEKIQREEEERIGKEEEMRKEEDMLRRQQEELERLAKEKLKQEEERRKAEEEKLKREEEEKMRKEEEMKRKVEEEKFKRQEEERMRKEEEIKRKAEEEKLKREEEERMRKEEEMRQEEERVRKEKEELQRLEEEKVRQEKRRKEEEERIKKEEQEMIRKEKEEERARQERDKTQRLAVETKRPQDQEKRIEGEDGVRGEERDRKERKGKEARKQGKENLTREAEEQTKRESRTNEERVAGNKCITSTNPFDEDISYNSSEEISKSPSVPHSHTTEEETVQQRCQSSVSLVTTSTNEKDPNTTQREKRPAPLPPGKNQAEKPRHKEHNVSTERLSQMNKQTKDVKTVSVLPQRSVQTITLQSKSSLDSKNTQSSVQNSTIKVTTAKQSRRPAPSRPSSVDEPSSESKTTLSSGKISHRDASETKQVQVVYGLNPFEGDEDDDELIDQDDTAVSGNTGPVHWPAALSQTADKDASNPVKVKSSKIAHAPPPPAKNDEGHGTGNTGTTVPNNACDPQVEAKSRLHFQKSPNQVSQQTEVQMMVVAGVGEEGPPPSSRRLQPVKPLNAPEQQSALVVKGEKDPKGVQDKTKVIDSGMSGPYSQLTQEELISLVLKQESQLSERDKTISELEQYIDNLLVRVIEEQPSILMSLSSLKKAA